MSKKAELDTQINLQNPMNSHKIKNRKIYEFLDYLSDSLLMSDVLGNYDFEFCKTDKFEITVSIRNREVKLLFLKEPLDSNIHFESTICVFYLFNYYNFEQLLLSVHSFIEHVLLSESDFGYKSAFLGYYDVLFSRHVWYGRHEQYIKNESESLQYYHFSETLACRKTVMEFKDLLMVIIKEISAIPNFKVESALQSNDSEALYLYIRYKEHRTLKISIRNHPIFTKCQVCFYLNKYISYEELKEHILNFFYEYDWENHDYNTEDFVEVTPEDYIVKRNGQDLDYYSEDQKLFLRNTQMVRDYMRTLGNPLMYLRA